MRLGNPKEGRVNRQKREKGNKLCLVLSSPRYLCLCLCVYAVYVSSIAIHICIIYMRNVYLQLLLYLYIYNQMSLTSPVSLFTSTVHLQVIYMWICIIYIHIYILSPIFACLCVSAYISIQDCHATRHSDMAVSSSFHGELVAGWVLEPLAPGLCSAHLPLPLSMPWLWIEVTLVVCLSLRQ